jgi:4,5-DOPA dioxygenase extradiol
MDRRLFLGLLAGGTVMTGVGALNGLLDRKSTARMPVLFLGHGSPMNAIADNNFTKTLGSLGERVQRPTAILVVSAHWMSEGTWVTGMQKPKTIHDFYGFPQALFDVQYPAPGSPETAKLIQAEIQNPKINIDHEMWGLDHGTWSVLKHMYPKADIPVMQLSIYMSQPPEYHVKLGEELRKLREKGVLIVSSGNIVHNLRRIVWDPAAPSYDWAIEFDQWVKEKLEKRDFSAIQNDVMKSEAGKLSVPTPDHWYPLLYTIGASDKNDSMKFEYEEMQNGSISMRCVSFGMEV